ncbi:IMP dehydrogenase [Ilumatobacter sp.]|uniref:IMP dehydrogenase n=1 Tax=Ilumatobacter sp. TaxID=1967498 RepID=UPI003AF845EF
MSHINDGLFDRYEALTFDDVVVVPGYSETLPDAVDTSALFARDIELTVPLVSAAMDKVTEGRMAIAMARYGGIGVIHRNMSIEEQAAEVQKVKRSQSGMISDPVTLSKEAKLFEAEELMNRFKFSGVPITNAAGELVGILTNRDIRFCEGSDFERPISEFMTSEGLVTAKVGTSLDEAKLLLQQHRIEKLPLVDDHGQLAGLITVKDIQKRLDYPNASRDDRGRLRCAAACGVGDDVEDRVDALVEMGVDAVAIDTAHGHSAGVIKTIERIKGSWPDLAVTAGNVVTDDGVQALAKAGADAVKVGVGAGSICTTRIISGAGMPQLSAIFETAKKARQIGIPIIGDGGITYSGDVVKAIAAGSSTVMLGSLLAGTEESPGETELFEGRRFKSYRGMGSLGAMQGLGADRYASAQSSVAAASRKLVPEGIEGRVPYSGPLADTIYQLVGGLRSGMGYAGASDLEGLRTGARFMRVTTAGREESHPHDVTITKEAPNYQRS